MASYMFMVLAAQATRRRPDWVIGSTVHPLAPLAGLLVARSRGARFALEVRDIWPQTLIDMEEFGPRGPVVLVLSWLERLLYSAADHTITLLETSVPYMGARGARHSRISWIPNGVDISLARGDAADADAAIPAAFDIWRREFDFIAIYGGALGRSNGAHVIVDAGSILMRRGSSRIGIAIVGNGPESERVERARSRLDAQNVLLVGAIPRRALPGVLRAADVGIVRLAGNPVFRFGISPNKLFDYLSQGLPTVVVVDPPGQRLLSSRAVVSAPPEDAAGLADALEHVASLPPAARREMGARGMAYALANHDIARLAERLEAVPTR